MWLKMIASELTDRCLRVSLIICFVLIGFIIGIIIGDERATSSFAPEIKVFRDKPALKFNPDLDEEFHIERAPLLPEPQEPSIIFCQAYPVKAHAHQLPFSSA